MARRPNYNFEKRKKELDRKARKDAKREERRRRRDETPDDAEPDRVPPAEHDPPAQAPER